MSFRASHREVETLVLLIRETRFRYTHGNDPEWIFFIDGSAKKEGAYEFHYLVGKNYDYLGMEAATPEAVTKVTELVKKLKR